MIFKQSIQYLILFFLCLSAKMNAQEIWDKIDDTTFELNTEALNNILNNISKEKNTTAIINFPDIEGKLIAFKISDNSLLPENLALKYPSIHAYKGFSINDSNLSITLTCTPTNITGTFIKGTDIWSLKQLENTNIYEILDDTEALTMRINCENESHDSSTPAPSFKSLIGSNTSQKTLIGDNTLRILRTAITVTGEYSNYFINKSQTNSSNDQIKKAAVLGGIVTTLNNLNTVFERDLGVRFELVENNDELIFLDENTDPFLTSESNNLIDTGNAQIVNIIGLDNFDIGHVLSIGFAGLAEVRALCSNRKGQAVTAGPVPEGTAFDFTLLAHEIGHQLGANHTQNSNCQRNNTTAVEPGAASTIMGYAGVQSCADYEIQSISDEYFHIVSINQIKEHIQSISCGIESSPVTNSTPVIEVIPNYSIPANTNFTLRANATDADNDLLTYCWEQIDNEIATMPPIPTSTGGPLFRSLPPSLSPSRNFPAQYNVNTTWEVLPSVSREMNFGLTVRDGNPGGIATVNLTVSVVETGEQFIITSPRAGESFPQNSIRQIEWNVAGTTSNDINTINVNIELSYDNGITFPVMLAENTPNDGVERVTIPVDQVTELGKIRITPTNNIYYTQSTSSFTISPEVDDDLAPIINLVEKEIDIQIYKLQVPEYEFILYDVIGQIVLSQTLTSDSPDPIDISHLNRGMYIFKLIVGSQIYTRKIVKL